MDQQPRYGPQAASSFFADGAATRSPVPGTVARGELRTDPIYWTGRDPFRGPAADVPFSLRQEDRDRGAERYEIFCTPCHDSSGRGDGTVPRRTGIQTADLTTAAAVAMKGGELFRLIGDGKGLMRGYRGQIPVRDRWLIVAHVRRLQEMATEEDR